jgi:hypothetical protein
LRVRAVTYATPDKQDQVLAFYKKALGRYGDVITCQNNAAVGTPAATSEGLNCSEDKSPKVQVDQGDYSLGKGSLELKAGSKRHQHIVGFESPRDGQTRFALVALDLPAVMDKDAGKSD